MWLHTLHVLSYFCSFIIIFFLKKKIARKAGNGVDHIIRLPTLHSWFVDDDDLKSDGMNKKSLQVCMCVVWARNKKDIYFFYIF